MIKLEVNEECHNCPFFKPDYDRDVFYTNNFLQAPGAVRMEAEGN